MHVAHHRVKADQEAPMLRDRLAACEERALCTRIIGEFLEMPGLNVTIAQACRLWSIDRPQCTHVLDTLLGSGFLRRSGDRYVRADGGRRAA
jgi:hypothetical protein